MNLKNVVLQFDRIAQIWMRRWLNAGLIWLCKYPFNFWQWAVWAEGTQNHHNVGTSWQYWQWDNDQRRYRGSSLLLIDQKKYSTDGSTERSWKLLGIVNTTWLNRWMRGIICCKLSDCQPIRTTNTHWAKKTKIKIKMTKIIRLSFHCIRARQIEN